MKLLSLFSGCGGMDLGFKQAGFDIIWANDFDADAQVIYKLNIGDIDGRDILNVGEDELPDCDIITAGFPCQPFSNAGKRRGIHDSRGMLYKECLRIIEKKMPKVFVFENVKGLLSTKYIDGRDLASVIKEDLSGMSDIGYNVVCELINAADYGVPQNRQRVIFVGIRKDLNKTFRFPDKMARDKLTLGEILNMDSNVPNQVHWQLSPQALEMIEFIPEGGSWKDVPYEHLAPRFKKIRDDMKRYHSPNFYRRFARNEIAGTITASAQPENCGIIHPTQNRRFTIREVARIQTFPDDFLFIDNNVKNITAMYKVIGNAVPPKLAKAIALAIKEQVFSDEKILHEEKKMDTDRAYLLGLIIGGGIWGNNEDVFRIRLPYKQWGSYEENPQRAGQISKDVMRVVSPMLRAVYGLNVSYDTTAAGEWNILCEGDTTMLRKELDQLGIKCEGEIRKSADISKIVPLLIDDNLKRRFIAGLADTIGSTKNSHRRFTDDKQMISFEISGFGFGFVCALCKLLHSIKCYPDQILWNHPNFHCGSNPYDKRWKKGFKLRVYLDQYDKFGSFAFTSKVVSSKNNLALEKQANTAIPCDERPIPRPNVSCVHTDENSKLLPLNIRGGHYLHNRHVCAVLGCSHAPYAEVQKILNNSEHFINPFPVLLKGSKQEIDRTVKSYSIYANRTYTTADYSIQSLLDMYNADPSRLLLGNDVESGYPLNKIIAGVTYLVAAALNRLKKSRPQGQQDVLLGEYLQINPNATVTFKIPDLLTPLIINLNNVSAMVGPSNPKVYKKLTSIDKNNPYKLLVREITEADLI